MTNANLSMNSVVSYYNHYHDKVKSNPKLYAWEDGVTLTLPQDMLEFSNSAAGHSGFSSGARPVGIRRNTRKHYNKSGYEVVKEIFSTPDSLYEFIMTSECDGPAYCEKVRKANNIAETQLKIEDIREAANSTLRAEKGAYLPKIGGMKGAIEIREMVEGQKEFFRNVGDVIEMTTDLMIIRIAA